MDPLSILHTMTGSTKVLEDVVQVLKDSEGLLSAIDEDAEDRLTSAAGQLQGIITRQQWMEEIMADGRAEFDKAVEDGIKSAIAKTELPAGKRTPITGVADMFTDEVARAGEGYFTGLQLDQLRDSGRWSQVDVFNVKRGFISRFTRDGWRIKMTMATVSATPVDGAESFHSILVVHHGTSAGATLGGEAVLSMRNDTPTLYPSPMPFNGFEYGAFVFGFNNDPKRSRFLRVVCNGPMAASVIREENLFADIGGGTSGSAWYPVLWQSSNGNHSLPVLKNNLNAAGITGFDKAFLVLHAPLLTIKAKLDEDTKRVAEEANKSATLAQRELQQQMAALEKHLSNPNNARALKAQSVADQQKAGGHPLGLGPLALWTSEPNTQHYPDPELDLPASKAEDSAPLKSQELVTTGLPDSSGGTKLSSTGSMSSNVPAVVESGSLTKGPSTELTVEAVTSAVASVRSRVVAQQEHRQREGDLAKIVFAYWGEVMKKPRALFDAKRAARIIARLRENKGDVSELLYAVDGAERDDWLMGRDAKSGGRKYNDIDTVFRDRAQVERLAERISGYNSGTLHPVALILHNQVEGKAGG